MDEFMKQLVNLARQTSPYFTKLYAQVPFNADHRDLPVTNHVTYWESSNKDRRNVMTAPQVDGVVMRTGGTTSRPKTTAYSQVELQKTTNLLAQGLLAGGVRAGDRIANMFYAGDLYGSFLLHTLSIPTLPIPAVHLPIGGFSGAAEAVDMLQQCAATVLLTTPTSLVNVCSYVMKSQRRIDSVRLALFAGEPLFPEQETLIKRALPRVTIRSCIYGTIDAGVLATSGRTDDSQSYQALIESVHIEILAEDGTVINEPDKIGMLHATNTVRQLCPVIRYPTGDRAVWTDREKGTFRLFGRASQAVRLGPVSIDMTDLRRVVSTSTNGALIEGVQAVVSRKGMLDQLECVVASPEIKDENRTKEAIVDEMYVQSPMFQQHVQLGLVAPLAVRFEEGIDKLQLASGSHKVRDIVECRF